MKDSPSKPPDRTLSLDVFETLAGHNSTMQFRDLTEVSEALMAGYARFVRQGVPREMVGYAMLGATINLYDIFDMQAGLPELLRHAADRIELHNASELGQAN